MLKNAFDEHPCSHDAPWGIIVGFDEFAPGNKLKIDNGRKVMNVSLSFVEFGQSVLCSESAWWTPVVLRSKVINSAVGGWSHFFRLFLRELMLGPLGFSTAGVPVQIDGAMRLVFAKVTNALSDGEGFRMAYDWKGHASLRPCLRHWNILRKDSPFVPKLSLQRSPAEPSSQVLRRCRTFQRPPLVKSHS